MELIQSILTQNPCYIKGEKTKKKGGMLHSIGCPQPKAPVLINSWNSGSAGVCVHGFIDGETGAKYQTLPWDIRAWHCGSGKNGSGNDTHIGIEMCEPACIKYKPNSASFTCSNLKEARAVAKRTYKSAVEYFAYLCIEHDWDPLEDGVIISHKEGHARGIASNHGDPEHLWQGLGLNYTMDGFRKDVKEAVDAQKKPVIYCVQVGGALVKKVNAKKRLKKVKAAGFEACMVEDNGKYKVQAGAYSVKANARAQLAKIQAAGFKAYVKKK